MFSQELERLYGIKVQEIYRNHSPAGLYELALKHEPGSAVSDKGALIVSSGEKTGRTPKDKRIVVDEISEKDVWWGDINIGLKERVFMINRERAIDYLNTKERLFVMDGYAGWDEKNRIKVRVVTSRAYHALFMNNMLIRPSKEDLAHFGEPDYVIFNSGEFPANKFTEGMTSDTSVCLSFQRKEMIILGTQYAGEMKKGVFTIMNYIMPKNNILSMHCSANVDEKENLTIFFGLSGTGKTTLSACPNRRLIGDDEHCWTDHGVFNIEGGCYAKAINLSPEKEPEIYNAIRFGTVLENVVYDQKTREVDFENDSFTQNTRISYPIEYIDNALIPCTGPTPNNVVFLTCDAFGVLPPVSKLTPEQAMYHFISGYTAKVAGTEMGVTEPEATFSACFGAAFMVWHPQKYAELLKEKIQNSGADVWLVNTGWHGGSYGTGKRFDLKYSRAIVDAINTGMLKDVQTRKEEFFGLEIPLEVPNVPGEFLNPRENWQDKGAYDETASGLCQLFKKNFKSFEDGCTKEVLAAGPLK